MSETEETESAYDPTSLEGVPEAGRARLQQNRAGLFTSDLSVNEFLLIKQAGFDPVGLVVGSSIYHIGIQLAGWKKSQEMTVLSEAMYGARQLAMTRMEEEADQLGADGVVGVRLDIGRYEWGQDMAEFIAIGTAVKHREGKLHRAPNGRPFTSDLSGQDFWTLLRTGHRPVGMVMGSCVYHVAHRGMLKSMAQTGRNVELSNFTQALYDARELAMERMQSEAQTLSAEGIVGVDLQEKSHGWGSHTIEFFAVGTAIVPSEDQRRTAAVIDLSSRRPVLRSAMSLVITEDRGAARHVVLNRAEKRNAMSQELLRALADALREATTDESVHCVVLRGEGPVFSAGVDLGELMASASTPGNLRPFRNTFLDCAEPRRSDAQAGDLPDPQDVCGRSTGGGTRVRPTNRLERRPTRFAGGEVRDHP